ncbi:MAG: hypothetical protein H6641_16725 [Caldilineaceae bacterium]|nr:hypothetical protein [Caldilineaceae bacterium]
MNLIGSHDTHRIISLLGDARLVDVAFGLLAAYPGVPMIHYGDEIGLAAMGPEYAHSHAVGTIQNAGTSGDWRTHGRFPGAGAKCSLNGRGCVGWWWMTRRCSFYVKHPKRQYLFMPPAGRMAPFSCRRRWWALTLQGWPARPTCRPMPRA